jgi:hypothetical protein
MEDGQAYSHPKSPQHITDDDENPAPPPKRSKGKKKSKKKSTVVDSSSESDDHVTSSKKGPGKLTVASENAMEIDSEIEEIPNPKETSEDELGE